jgi:hypothetical protein
VQGRIRRLVFGPARILAAACGRAGGEAADADETAAGARVHRGAQVTQGDPMLWTIVLILLVLWALGFATSYTMGGLIHALLVIAVVVVVIRLLQGRKVL